MQEKQLLAIRAEIDTLDSQLLALLNRRAELALKTAKHKLATMQSAKIFAPERELTIISRLVEENKGPLSNNMVADIFQTIINHSRNLQCIKYPKQDRGIRVAVQGDKGSFSEQAAKRFCSNKLIEKFELDFAFNSQRVVTEVLQQKVDYGIVALNNARGGLVLETIDALTDKEYRIVDMFDILVQQNLLINAGQSLEDISYVYSHPQALAQCQSYLAKNLSQAQACVYEDTALAAKDLAQGELPENSAVIASLASAETYQLTVAAESIQDLNDNHTLFLALAKR